MATLDFRVDDAQCIRCDACVRDCVSGVIVRENGAAPRVPAELLGDGCLECQHCLAVCPTGAVSVFGLSPENSLPLSPATLPSRAQMKTFARGRRSVRQFRPGNVDAALVDELLADAAHAPTGCNDRALRFTVVDGRPAMVRLLEQVVAALEAPGIPDFLADGAAAYRADGTDEFFRGAPHLLLAAPAEKAHCGQEDAVIALAYFELLAQSAGLATTWCGYLPFAVEAAPSLRGPLGLGPDQYFYAMLFGHPAVRYARTVQRDGAAEVRRLDV